jgi:hypothetical protein
VEEHGLVQKGARRMLQEWRRWLHAFALQYREALPTDAMYERWRAMHMRRSDEGARGVRSSSCEASTWARTQACRARPR